jgi:hypothetical protein
MTVAHGTAVRNAGRGSPETMKSSMRKRWRSAAAEEEDGQVLIENVIAGVRCRQGLKICAEEKNRRWPPIFRKFGKIRPKSI